MVADAFRGALVHSGRGVGGGCRRWSAGRVSGNGGDACSERLG